MIQIYSPDNTDYAKNGNMTLTPEMCELSMEINGVWDLNIVHPMDVDGRWKYIEDNAVISVDTPIGEKQLFRIYKKTRNMNDIEASARPIFLDSTKDVFLLDTRPTNKNGQQALNEMTKGTKYIGHSDIGKINTAYYIRKNLIEALASDDDQSFLNRWGGEILYNNFDIYINEKTGQDNGVSVRYGKNLQSIKEIIDMDNVITRIVPVAYNGYMLDGSTPWVDSPNIGKYPIIHIREIKFDDVKLQEDITGDDEQGYATLAELRKELIRRAKQMFTDGVDKPTVTLNIEMVDLSQTLEYKNYKLLENVSLGDTVICVHDKLEIETSARVIAMKWDCILQRSISLTIGQPQYDYFKSITSTINNINGAINSNGDVVAERIAGVINMINTQLKVQKDVAKKQDVRAILFEDLDPASPTYGAMCLGTQGFQISRERTADSRDWKWTTAFTAEGGYADVLIAGILSSKDGSSYWDLENSKLKLKGEFQMNGGKININNNSGEDVIRLNGIKTNGNKTSLYISPSQLSVTDTTDGIWATAQSEAIGILNKKTLDNALFTQYGFQVKRKPGEGYSHLTRDSLLINYDSNENYCIVSKDEISITDKTNAITTHMKLNEITAQGPSGQTIITPGQIRCYDSRGYLVFDSNNLGG